MEGTLKEKFIAKLVEKYGSWNQIRSKFGATSFGEISRDLSISSSQFSKLISGSATEGMYQRSIENIERLIRQEEIHSQLESTIERNRIIEAEIASIRSKSNSQKRNLLLVAIFSLLLGGLSVYSYYNKVFFNKPANELSKHPLSRYFDKDFDAIFDSPYLDLTEVQEFCPCSAYEGIWSLSNSYKLPLPGSRNPGLYYVAKQADVRMKCSKHDTLGVGKGRALMGYEYLVNEIWVDTDMTPLSPTYFNKELKTYTQSFKDLVFEENSKFKKVATIHSFFIDRFEIYDDSIVRKGEPCGRFASDIDESLTKEFEIDVKYILEEVLGDLTTTQCNSAVNPFCDPNQLTEKESEIIFDCIYTIELENLGIGGYPYQKGYRLEKQIYKDNITCKCRTGV